MDKVNLSAKLAQFTDHWQLRIVGELNGQHVKLVKLLGEFTRHHHDDEDGLFLVIKARRSCDLSGARHFLKCLAPDFHAPVKIFTLPL